MKLGVLASHPIQYQAPLFRRLASQTDLKVFFADRQSAAGQAAAGFGVEFQWDVNLLDGYPHLFLRNHSRKPDVAHFFGSDAPDVATLIAQGRYDAFLVMGWHLKSYWQAILACRQARVPVLVRGDSQLAGSRGALRRAVKAAIYPSMLSRFDGLLYVGKRNREYLEHYGARPGQLFFSPHCVDIDFFAGRAASTDRQGTRAAWGLQSGDRAILFVGKMLERKRPRDLVNALAILRRRGVPAVGIFAGDGSLRTDLEALGRKCDVPMRFLGFRNQSQLPEAYASADLLALPSDSSETWGLVVNEALACGLPCAVSDACGCGPDLIVPGVTGVVFPAGDCEALAQAIQEGLRIPRASEAMRVHVEKYSVAAAGEGIIAAVSALSRGTRGP